MLPYRRFRLHAPHSATDTLVADRLPAILLTNIDEIKIPENNFSPLICSHSSLGRPQHGAIRYPDDQEARLGWEDPELAAINRSQILSGTASPLFDISKSERPEETPSNRKNPRIQGMNIVYGRHTNVFSSISTTVSFA
jgi:hypothetical protein